MSLSSIFNVPPIGPRMGKEWGWTQLVAAYNSVEIHRIHVDKGGFCSRHYHHHKWNRFILVNGRLAVRIYRNGDGGMVDETVLTPDWVTDVPRGYWHEFEALEDVDGLEVYWVPLDPDDIERDAERLGGMKAG